MSFTDPDLTVDCIVPYPRSSTRKNRVSEPPHHQKLSFGQSQCLAMSLWRRHLELGGERCESYHHEGGTEDNGLHPIKK